MLVVGGQRGGAGRGAAVRRRPRCGPARASCRSPTCRSVAPQLGVRRAGGARDRPATRRRGGGIAADEADELAERARPVRRAAASAPAWWTRTARPRCSRARLLERMERGPGIVLDAAAMPRPARRRARCCAGTPGAWSSRRTRARWPSCSASPREEVLADPAGAARAGGGALRRRGGDEGRLHLHRRPGRARPGAATGAMSASATSGSGDILAGVIAGLARARRRRRCRRRSGASTCMARPGDGWRGRAGRSASWRASCWRRSRPSWPGSTRRSRASGGAPRRARGNDKARSRSATGAPRRIRRRHAIAEVPFPHARRQPTHRPRGRALRHGRRPLARAGRPALPARRHLGRAGRELRAVLGPRHEGRALPVRRRRASARSSASSCRNTPTRSGTAICRTRGRARSTATACTGPTSRSTATASTPTSCCSTPTPRRSSASSRWADALFGYRIGSPSDDLSFDERDSAPFMPKCRVIDPAFTWGRDAPPARAVGPDDLLRDARAGFTMLHPGGAGGAARHLRRARRTQAVVDYIKSLGVTSVELLPIHAFVDDQHLLDKGLTQLLGLQHASASSRPIRAMSRDAATPRRVQGDGRAPPRCRASR